MNPLVSIIIPLFNREEYIKDTLDSVLTQTYPDWECIIVDDGSTDNSLEIAKSYAGKDHRFKVFVRDREPKNANTCRNIGAEKTSGDFIAFLDSDDQFFPDYLERRIEKIKESDADFIYGSAVIDGNGLRYIKITRQIYKEENPLNFLLGEGFAPTSSLFMKAGKAKQIRWDEKLRRHQDYDYFYQAAKELKVVADYEPAILINWTGIRNIDYESTIEYMEKHFKEISPENYLSYNKLMFNSTFSKQETIHYSEYYRKKAKSMIKHLSFMEFQSYYRRKNFFKIQLLKLYFVTLNLFRFG